MPRGMDPDVSPRQVRRNRARERAIIQHPSMDRRQNPFMPSTPPPGEGQLFSDAPYKTPPKVQTGPQPRAEQQQLPFQGTIKVGGQKSPFADKGLGRYVNRNANGLQFNKPAIHQAVNNAVEAYSDAKFFSQHGFGAALRHTLGMAQEPSHRSDDINARRRRAVLAGQNVTGANPGYVKADRPPPRQPGEGESAWSFDVRHGHAAPDLSW